MYLISNNFIPKNGYNWLALNIRINIITVIQKGCHFEGKINFNMTVNCNRTAIFFQRTPMFKLLS